MKLIREKLRSQSGASILLALLFFLVCVMVSASILAAASSNAGKIRSSYEEQQHYMALSSALQLVSSQLEQAEYRGRYTVNEWNETIFQIDEDGYPIVISSIDYYNVVQNEGAFSCGDLAKLNPDGTSDETAVLTFLKEMDGVFAGKFNGVGYKKIDGAASLPANLSVTVTVGGDADIQEKFSPVTVQIDMNRNCCIHLKARLDTVLDEDGKPAADSHSYVMEAEMVPRLIKNEPDGSIKQLSGSVPSICSQPGIPKDNIPNASVSGLDVTRKTPREETTEEAVTWELDRITPEV